MFGVTQFFYKKNPGKVAFTRSGKLKKSAFPGSASLFPASAIRFFLRGKDSAALIMFRE